MVKFLKPNKAVILLQGRFAGHKAKILKNDDDGTRDRPYGHCLVSGIAKYPSKVTRKDSAKKQAKKSRVKAFVKLVNYNHIMPTRYTLDIDLKDVVTSETQVSRGKKVTACKEIKFRFEERVYDREESMVISRFDHRLSSLSVYPWMSPMPQTTLCFGVEL